MQMQCSESIKELAVALAKAQGALEGAKKDSTNPHFKSQYADLASCVAALKTAFPQHGLSYVQFVCTGDSGVGVETMLMHSSGEWMRGDPFFLPVVKADAQAFGSALTYARRYSLSAITGLSAADDDGNAASSHAPTEVKHKPMGPGEYARHKGAINDAPNMEELQRAFTVAYVAATAAGDHDAVNRLTDMKDQRKEALKPQAQTIRESAMGLQGARNLLASQG
jgi:hypothetical protein